MTNGDEYWRHVTTGCFARYKQLGCPTFFLRFTMNTYWVDYVALERCHGTYFESAMAAVVSQFAPATLMPFVQSAPMLRKMSAFMW
jgi:hypothetical protein